MTKILDAVRQKSVEKAEARQILTQEMLARNGRHPPKPTDLSNILPEGNNKPKQPVPGVYDDWSCFIPDRTTVRALVDAGYFPLPEYIDLYGDDDGA